MLEKLYGYDSVFTASCYFYAFSEDLALFGRFTSLWKAFFPEEVFRNGFVGNPGGKRKKFYAELCYSKGKKKNRRRETMERNFTNLIPIAPRGICIKNKNTRNSLRGSLLQSLAFLFFMLFLSLSLFTGNSVYASNLAGPGVKSLSSQKELRAVWFSYLDWMNMP